VHCNGDKDFLKQLPTRHRFEQGSLAVQSGFVDDSKGNMVAAKKSSVSTRETPSISET